MSDGALFYEARPGVRVRLRLDRDDSQPRARDEGSRTALDDVRGISDPGPRTPKHPGAGADAAPRPASLNRDLADPVGRWERELLAAGWTRHRGISTVWRAPDGTLHLGPAGAWRTMRSARLMGAA